jgi:peptide/nickel transport system permease protein
VAARPVLSMGDGPRAAAVAARLPAGLLEGLPTEGVLAGRVGFWRKFVRNPLGVVGGLLLLAVAVSAIFAERVAPQDPARQSLLNRFAPPAWTAKGTWKYPLGSDQVGRDVLSRIIHGTRVSLVVGLSAVSLSLVIGVILGLLSGTFGGRVDTVIMTVVDIFLTFPSILLALAIVAVLGPGLVSIIIAIGLTGWERYARVVRAEVLALREKEFVLAARAIGATGQKVIFRHILPNTFSSIIVMGTLQTAQAILAEAALSFLGLGTGRAYPSWGQMISLGRDYVNIAWWLPTFPGLAILFTVVAINLVGDRLRDLLDPRVR